MEWSDGEERRLRRLWAEGLPSAEIGRRMLHSKNAVIGKAHRLGLPDRLSPIRKAGTPDPYAAVHKPVPRGRDVPSLSPLPSLQAPAPTIKAKAVSKPKQPPVVRAIPSPKPDAPPCCFPVGVNARREGIGFYCNAPSKPGSPYCAEHHALCYQPVRAWDKTQRYAIHGVSSRAGLDPDAAD